MPRNVLLTLAGSQTLKAGVERNRFAEEEMSFFAGRFFHVGAVFASRKG